MVYKNSKKGAQGIGTLIIFIALILVAAVAAGVLISTVGKLQGKAENTGTQVQQKLGTGFDVFEVVVSNTNDSVINASVDNFEVSVQLAPGSDSIKLSDNTVTLVTNTGAFTYKFNSTTEINGSINTVTKTGTFGQVYIKGPSLLGYISKDDTVKFVFPSGSNIPEKQEFTIRLFPGSGTPLPIKLVTPPAMTNYLTVLK